MKDVQNFSVEQACDLAERLLRRHPMSQLRWAINHPVILYNLFLALYNYKITKEKNNNETS